VTTLVFLLARPNSQTQPTTHTQYPHTPTDGHALQAHPSEINTMSSHKVNNTVITCKTL